MKPEYNLGLIFAIPTASGIAFFDSDKLVVLTNGFQKKTQKTPKQEIEKALKIKKEYENENK